MMEALGKILLAILLILVVPSLVVWGGWHLVGLIPPDARDAIMTLVPYGIAVVAWGLLAWLCGNIFVSIVG